MADAHYLEDSTVREFDARIEVTGHETRGRSEERVAFVLEGE